MRTSIDSSFETLNSTSNNNKIKKALLSLSCSSPSSSAASAPSAAATVRSSAEWNHGKRSTRRRIKQQQQQQQQNDSNNKKKERIEYSDDSTDCVVRHHAMMVMMMNHQRGGGRHDAERIHREIMMFQTRMMSGRMTYDPFRDWRLDVDRMSYEELLELGDRIGYVSTGLREEEITHSITKAKLSTLDTSPAYFSTEMEKKCSICQEEYEVNNEIGKLECGHGYHMYCIKQWLLRKNACPVCKTAVSKA